MVVDVVFVCFFVVFVWFFVVLVCVFFLFLCVCFFVVVFVCLYCIDFFSEVLFSKQNWEQPHLINVFLQTHQVFHYHGVVLCIGEVFLRNTKQ